MDKIKILAYVLVSGFFFLNGCNKEAVYDLDAFYSERTLKIERVNFKSELIQHTIENIFTLKLNADTETKWQEAFWAMQLVQYKSAETKNALSKAVEYFPDAGFEFKRALLEILYGMYAGEFNREVENFLQNISDPKIFSMAVLYLMKDTPTKEAAEKFKNQLTAKYYDWGYHPITLMLYTDLESIISEQTEPLPPIEDLLLHEFEQNSVIVFSFQRKNRNYPGVTIIRDKDGNFVRDEYGILFSVSQLAKSVSGLPTYLTNGNTPAGIYKINSVSESESKFIGPTPTLVMALPFEEDYYQFATPVSKGDTLWDKKTYRQIFPQTWQYYTPIYGSFFAGWAGRNEIIIHGTTIDPDHYKGKSYYPYTPSLGCVTSLELWNGDTGKLKESEQLKLVNMYQKLNPFRGYFILVDLDDKEAPVTTKDLMEYIIHTGK